MIFADWGRPGGVMDYLSAMRAFVRAVELGSFSKAAAECGAKVSTVSRYIAALEEDVGAALLNRSTRRLKLTEAGAAFYERAAHIVVEVEDARLATAAMNSRPQGLLKINMPGAFGRLHVVPHLVDFMAEYPDIRVDATLTDATVDLIEVGADVAVRIGSLQGSTLVGKRLAPHRRVVCASPRYLAGVKAIRSPTDLAELECLEFALQPSNCWYFYNHSEKKPIGVMTTGRVRINDSEALLEATIAGLGVALLPTWLIAPHVRAGRLALALADWEGAIFLGPARFVWGVYPQNKAVSPKVRAFMTFIERRYGRPPYWDLDIVKDNSPRSSAFNVTVKS
jgi:DNA-binding transcriptional LysR family regulator